MNYTYASTLSSIILFSSMSVFAMHNNQFGQSAAENGSKVSEIVRASIIQTSGQEYFNVRTFKEYIAQHGAKLTTSNFISASRITYIRLNYDPQERIIAMRDYTAAMIAINKIKPGPFYQTVIDDNKQEIMSYYQQIKRDDLLHVAHHRFELCNCERYADCNWPALQQ